MNKLISIVIPAFNAAKTIRKTISSVLNQSYSNFELIIVDDCSKDNTVKLINEFNDKRIKFFINKSNLGFEGNWNEALSKASGEYIKLLPDDDTLEIDALELQYKTLESNPNVIFVGSKRNIIDENDNILMTRGINISNNKSSYKKIIKDIYRFGTNPIGEPASVLFRASTLNKNGIIFNSKYPHYIDLDFYIQLLKHGDYYYIDKSLSNFRVWSRSYSVIHRDSNLSESLDFFENLKKENKFLTTKDTAINRINIFKNLILKNLFYLYINYSKKKKIF